MKKFLKPIGYLILIPLVVLSMLLFPTQKSDAANLASAYVMLSRMKVSQTDIEMFIGFSPTGTIASGKVLELEFPGDEDSTWCNTAGSLTVTGVASTPADSTGDYDVDSALPGTLTATCSQGGASSADKIVISGLSGLTAATTYGVHLSGNVGKLGTPSTTSTHLASLTIAESAGGATIETMTFDIETVTDDEVDITAEVLAAPTVTCSIGSNSVDLGDLYAGGTYVTGSHDLTIQTSDSAAGYYWSVYGLGDGATAGLYKSTATTDLLESTETIPATSIIDLSIADSKGFGLTIDPLPNGAAAGTGFTSVTDGEFGVLGSGIDNAKILFYQNLPQSGSNDVATIIYGARADSTTQAGTYTETVTYVCGGYY